MGKRLLSAVAGLLCALLAAGCAAPAPAGPWRTVQRLRTPPGHTARNSGPRPNFVFVLTDDLTWNLVRYMPHVRALERSGTTMSHYYVVDSLCCPSRTAILTGEYPHNDGVYTNSGSDGGYSAFNRHGDQSRTFAVALQRAGYRTALMGKYLNGYQPQHEPAPGWDTWDATGNGYREFAYTLRENQSQHYYGSKPGDYLTDVLARKATSFIGSAASAGKPFMLEVATFAPHNPYTPAPRYAHAFESVRYPRTPAYDKLPASPPSWLRGRKPLSSAQETNIRNVYRLRVQADMSVDDLIGRLENELKAKGVAGNTYFVFSSDNGYHMGEYRLEPGKQTAFDTDINVPLIVTGPGVPAGHVVSQLASNIDLCPTFETLAGVPVPASVDGHSLAALWDGQDPPGWRQALLIEHHGPDDTPGDPDRQNASAADPPSYEAVRTATALYVRYSNGEQEYYNTADDPYELDNIAAYGIPAYLTRALTALETCRTGVACWAASHLGPGGGPPAPATPGLG